MIETLLLIDTILLSLIAWLLLADYVQKRHQALQARWFAIRRKVFKR